MHLWRPCQTSVGVDRVRASFAFSVEPSGNASASIRVGSPGEPEGILRSKLSQMMIEVLVHQYAPLLACERTEERMRMGATTIRACGGKPIDQSEESRPFHVHIMRIARDQLLCSRRIAVHGLIVTEREAFHDWAEDPPHECTLGAYVAECHLQALRSATMQRVPTSSKPSRW